jgi:hypothetical protein
MIPSPLQCLAANAIAFTAGAFVVLGVQLYGDYMSSPAARD